MEMKITDNQIKFFKEVLGVDVSKTKIQMDTLNEAYGGVYDSNVKGTIFLNESVLDKMNKVTLYTTITHELAHLIQHEYGKAISIPFKKNEMAEDYSYATYGLSWCERPLEIDAILTELYYLSYIGAPKDKVIKFGLKRFRNNKTKNIELCIKKLKANAEFTEIANTILDTLFPTREFNNAV